MQAFVFPGQGSQYSGMGKDLVENSPTAYDIFKEADEALGFKLSRLCFDAFSDQLVLTENTQPAVLTTSIAIFRELEKRGKLPDFVAGHSLGEYSALVAAKALDFCDAVQVVRERGRFMQEAVPFGEGAMVAVLGLKVDQVAKICREVSEGEVVSIANINSANQIVISGCVEAVKRASQKAKQKGAKRVMFLDVSGPFHCQLMRPAQKRLAHLMESVVFHDLRFPLVNNIKAEKVFRGDQARQGLIQQVSSTVLWSSCVEKLVNIGVTVFVEVGPGKVLTGLIRRICPGVQTLSISNMKELENYVRLF